MRYTSVMKIISQQEYLDLENKTEYNDFKRIADINQVANFYKICCTHLLTTSTWSGINLFYPISKISISDRYGFNVNRTAIVGDIIKIEYSSVSEFDSILYLKIDNIKQTKDDVDELFELILKIDQKPNLGRFYSYFNFQTSCKIKVRKNIDTISIESKINLTDYPNPFMEENNAMIAQFPWDKLIKNTLSKL